MSSPLFLGQDNELTLQLDQTVVATLIMEIVSSELTYMFAQKETGVLGRTTDLVDTIFKGLNGNIEFRSGDVSVFDLIDEVKRGIQRRTPPVPRLTLKAQFTSPSTGESALIVVPDLKLGDVGINTPNREEHVTFRMPWRAEDARTVRSA